jgi:hydrogenase expression/formation protein HypE
MTDRIGLAHGNGGRRTRALIDDVFAATLGEHAPDTAVDAARVQLPGDAWAVAVDGHTVTPLEFPGGSLGSLAAHGTINDLAVCGARAQHFTLSVILEEGLEMAVLQRLVEDFAQACREADVSVVAGDTKVVPRGHGGGAYFTTTGLGPVRAANLGAEHVRPGDRVVISGPIGDHGVAVMFAREQFEMRGDLQSDCASVLPLCEVAWSLPGVRFMRDPTRGGLATVALEAARAAGCSVTLDERSIPIRDPVASVCEMLGLDPYVLACEGRVVAFAEPEAADQLCAQWRERGASAAVIGTVEAGPARVGLRTTLGGLRALDELDGDPLPRIC